MVVEELERRAAEFLLRCPSRTALPVEEIRRTNRSILNHDSNEHDGEVYPDNTFRPFPLRLEIARYGGPTLSGASLDFFALSSLQALRFVAEAVDLPPSRRLQRSFRLLARQALGLAASGDELPDLLEYAVRSWPPLEPIASQGDRIFEQQPDDFQRLLVAEIDGLDSPATDLEAACRLCQEISGTESDVRRRIVRSQMHMTANRLGLTNLEEVYISRLLWRTAQELEESEPALWRSLVDRLGTPGVRPRPFRDLLALAFEDFFANRFSERRSDRS
jgi:hypothetical protein